MTSPAPTRPATSTPTVAENALTAAYLAGRPSAESLARRCAEDTALRAALGGNYLTRPVFLEGATARDIGVRLSGLYDLLLSLPHRLFDGDVRAFAAAAGWSPLQIATSLRPDGRPRTVPRIARSDLYQEAGGFKLLELNVGSPLGGFDTPLINRAMLGDEQLRRFAAEHRLEYADTLHLLVAMWREAFPELDFDAAPLVALVDWPTSFPSLEPRLRVMAEMLAPLGIEAVPCHAGQVETRADGVYVHGRRIDLVHRWFVSEDLVDPADAALAAPILAAADAGLVALFATLETELYGAKGCLALVSDERHRPAFDAAELALVDGLLPWTRMLADRKVEADGEQVDLLPYVLAHREEFTLKATAGHGGLDVLPGWQTGEAEWRAKVAAAAGGPYVVQRRVRPVVERFPVGDGTGRTEPVVVNWGVFMIGHGYGGAFNRGIANPEPGVISLANGASFTTAFHTPLD
ncbi:hypothetical protein K353_00227 [Kitasatospora sp. SolWspMP-SS2h]|uniref:hypothetical protein n=1 Tax=Kitasatospora sp. SolWspMP-SS2h TaxID=1305729 RepID=UPI000DBA7D0A|nr:hypothetical protein [Kitasatospora sp. SolWspMP-SS2h]RAJ47026.1 hypothetical protein K353_00227 [Kitasatospora sp. SolWspMP-SS2h]